MSTSVSTISEEVSIPDIEGTRIHWRVNNRSIVKRGETIAVYTVDPQKGPDKSFERETTSSTDGPIIRAKKRGSRTVPIPSCVPSKEDTTITANIKPLLGTLIGKILSNSSSQDTTMISHDHDKSQLSGKLLGTSSVLSQIPILAPLDGILYIYSTKQTREGNTPTTKTTTIQSNVQLKQQQQQQQPITMYQILGKIEKCSHPTIMDGLCAICGENALVHTNASKKSANLLSSSSSSTTGDANNNLTVSGGITVSISSDYAASFASETLSTLRKARKLQLVLDLDHTLVHATADPRAEYWKHEAGRTDVHTILLPMFDGYPNNSNNNNNDNGQLIKHFMKFRNYLAEFLNSVMDKYEVIIYTAGTRAYAKKTADAMSRHLLNYQKKKENNHISSPYCLDEDDLYALRAKVVQMEYDAKKAMDAQNRKNMVKLANEQWKRKNVTITDNNSTTMMSMEDEIITINETMTKNNTDDNENKIKSLKRKRVAFSEEGTCSDVIDLSHESTTNHLTSEVQNDKTNESDNFNPSASLQIIQGELKEAESRENEAIALRMKLFGSRIVSRTDVGDLGRDVKSLSRVFPCGGKMAVIVDDREDVWANADDFASEKQMGEPPDNLLLSRPFHWLPFVGYADINNASGIDITKQGSDTNSGSADDTDDVQLVWTSDILFRLYDRYYSNVDTADDDRVYETVPSILRQMRKEVLGGVDKETNIVLSGVIPINMQELAEEKRSYTRPPLIRYVEALGACIQTDVTADTTHVVAARDGTDKVKRARQVRGCSIVHVTWIMECYWSISLRETTPHAINIHHNGVVEKNKLAGKFFNTARDSSNDEEDDSNLDVEYD